MSRLSHPIPGRRRAVAPLRRCGFASLGLGLLLAVAACRATGGEAAGSGPTDRLRLIVETDAGGDPDDEQSLVRFLLYVNEWDVEGVIANRPVARDGENRNAARTGLGIVRRLVEAYGQCQTNLARHDPRYPTGAELLARTVPGYNDTDAAVNLILAAVDRPDPRPVWYSDWGSDRGSATNNLRRALDRVLATRGPAGYVRFKSRLRLASSDAFGPHTARIDPPFPFWVDTHQPELERRRWYHRFAPLTASAGGFDATRDLLTGHGPLGALYPMNTGPPQKEGDTMSFLYLVPTGMNDPERPGWGSWGGRYGPMEKHPGRPYFWANRRDVWHGTTNRDHTLGRWAEALQNDFRARLEWCVKEPAAANHPPRVALDVPAQITLVAGESRRFSAAASTDPEGNRLAWEWFVYPEAGTWDGPVTGAADGATYTLTAPPVTSPETVHLLVAVTDDGRPPLTRYARVVITVVPRTLLPNAEKVRELATVALAPPATNAPSARFGSLRRFDDGRPVRGAADWPERRRELLAHWHEVMGPWPPLLDAPALTTLSTATRDGIEHRRVRVALAPDQSGEGWLLIPPGAGPFPAVLVVYYEPETSIGLNAKQPLRDFARELARRGFVTLSLGTPGGDAWKPELGAARCQPLSFHAYIAANAWRALAQLPAVDAGRIGVLGHSYGGKWALFAGALWDRFAAVAVSDPGIAFDEDRPNVNYWEPWYLGREPSVTRAPGLPGPGRPRTGAYARLVTEGRDLHELEALIAPRPFFVSGGAEDPPSRWEVLMPLVELNRQLGFTQRVGLTGRATHDPTPESNARLYAFFEAYLKAGRPVTSAEIGAPAARVTTP